MDEDDQAQAKVRIDNEPPLFPVNHYFKTNNYSGDASSLAGLEKQNRELIQRINIIYRTKGKVDHDAFVGLYSSTWDLRKSLANLTERANKELYEKLLRARSIYDRKYMQEDYILKKKLYADAMLDKGYEKKTVVDKVKDWSIIPANPPFEPDPCKRVRCWMDLEGRHERKPEERTELDRLVIEVYLDMAPRSGENFVKMCRGDIFGFSYECTKIYKVYPGMFCVGGDVIKGNGVSGRSIFSVPFPNERSILEFNGPGVIGTYSEGDKGYTTSQFLISLSAVPSLKKHSVAFGRVISGFKTLERLSDLSKKSGNPFVNVIITKCGVACPDQEKIPYQPDFEIPDDILDHYSRKEDDHVMDEKMRMLFLEQTRFYKQHGYMVKVNPDKRYPPFPWVVQPEDASLYEDSTTSGMAFIMEAELRAARAKEEIGAPNEIEEEETIYVPPPAPPQLVIIQPVQELEQPKAEGSVIRIGVPSDLFQRSDFVRSPPTRPKGGDKGGKSPKGAGGKKDGDSSADGEEHGGDEVGETAKPQTVEKKKKKQKKEIKIKKNVPKKIIGPIKINKPSIIEIPKKPKYTGAGFSVRYPIKYLDEKDYQKCIQRCKQTIFCSLNQN